jgi:hypothetical protein
MFKCDLDEVLGSYAGTYEGDCELRAESRTSIMDNPVTLSSGHFD